MECVTIDNIDICSGIKQDGSPQIYNVYINELISKLLNKNLGCSIGYYA